MRSIARQTNEPRATTSADHFAMKHESQKQRHPFWRKRRKLFIKSIMIALRSWVQSHKNCVLAAAYRFDSRIFTKIYDNGVRDETTLDANEM